MYLEMNKKILRIDNYKQIKHIDHDLIILKEITLKGNNMKVKVLDKDHIIISGNFNNIEIRNDKNDLQD